METEKKKINPYIIIIVVLLVVIAGLLYNQWGKKILPASMEKSKEQEEGSKSIDTGVTKDDISMGNDDAPVTIVEYFSYFCGYCKLFDDQTKPRIVEDYVATGKVKLVFRVFPPLELGMAVLCANEQEKFLEYHNELFNNAENIQEVDDLKQIAKDFGLDENQFNQCFDTQKYLAKAQEWYQQGSNDFEEAGVPAEQRGTPAFFINGEMLIGAQPYDKFVEVIERKLSE